MNNEHQKIKINESMVNPSLIFLKYFIFIDSPHNDHIYHSKEL